VESVEDEHDPGLGHGGCLILETRKSHMAKIAVLQLDPGRVEKAVHDQVDAKRELRG
jgi:hypothetical protein